MSDDERERIRDHYRATAELAATGDFEAARDAESTWCASLGACTPRFGIDLYRDAERHPSHPAAAASLGCGIPTAVVTFRPGDVVLDLGSGSGTDVFLAAQRVGPDGRVIGLDMTTEVVELARRNALAAGVTNATFVEGYVEDIPLPDASVDVIISNCVVSLSTDKPAVFAEAFRVLKPAGTMALSDVVLVEDVDAGADTEVDQPGTEMRPLTVRSYRAALTAAGFVDVEVLTDHQGPPGIAPAILKGHKPREDVTAPV